MPAYTILGHVVNFACALVPGDMKWIASYDGELSNSAHYFSTFANANADMTTVNGSIGNKGTDTWRPWNYDDRLKVAAAVEEYKKQLTDSSNA